jgi:hypothetical protein
MSVARSSGACPAGTCRSATGSPPASRGARRSIVAPIAASTSRKPLRVGFTHTLRIVRPSAIVPASSAATIRNAADDGSPGTMISSPARPPSQPRVSMVARAPSTVIGAPR